ncbi:MAG: Tm-1-like ATP-binding domain-containing protein [Pirellulales bacterium]
MIGCGDASSALGIPKVISTVASGNTAPYVGISDIVMIPAVVDVAGLNRISRQVFTKAAAAVTAMAQAVHRDAQVTNIDRPIVCASMFGNTTRCVEHARGIMESNGYEVMTFHATGIGGRTMESLIAGGMIAGILDITTTEWADELVGGILTAGQTRLEAAARSGTPAIVVPGCLDMVNFGPRDSVPASFQNRLLYQHNPQITLMRTTPDECSQLGKILAQKVNASIGPVSVLIPLRGISVISARGGAFHDSVADAALFDAIRNNLRDDIELIEIDAEINDPQFAVRCADQLLALMQSELESNISSEQART